MSLAYRLLIVFLCIGITVGVAFYFWVPLYSYKGFGKALEGVLLMSTISLGFYGACLSVFASIFNTKAVKEVMSDQDYRKEFSVVALVTLFFSFVTVIITIVYQVILENEGLNERVYNWANSIWASFTVMFLFFNVLFILTSFLIFFANDEE